MKTKDFMSFVVEYISPDALIEDAAQKMKLLDVGFFPVCKDDRLVGTLTDRDIVLRVIAERQECKGMQGVPGEDQRCVLVL